MKEERKINFYYNYGYVFWIIVISSSFNIIIDNYNFFVVEMRSFRLFLRVGYWKIKWNVDVNWDNNKLV